jgi:hypothetical protein
MMLCAEESDHDYSTGEVGHARDQGAASARGLRKVVRTLPSGLRLKIILHDDDESDEDGCSWAVCLN